MTETMTEGGLGFLAAPPLAAMGWLVHGFGNAGWSEADFLDFAASKGLRPVIMRQVHSDVIHRLEVAPAGKVEGDALMTNVPGLLLVVRTADCLPVLLVDEQKRAVASVHCGWRGTRVRVLERAVREMGRAYGTDPARLVVALGPCIGPACYEVGPEVKESFVAAGFPAEVFEPVADRPGKSLLDLRGANAWLLHGLGVKKANIWTAEACTHCDPRLLSYRRDKGEPRRMYNFIGIRAYTNQRTQGGCPGENIERDAGMVPRAQREESRAITEWDSSPGNPTFFGGTPSESATSRKNAERTA
jgi:polyphenol oxidase